MWGIAFGNQYINNLLSERISWFFPEIQVLWNQNRIHQLPLQHQGFFVFVFVFFHFSILFHRNHISQYPKWKSVSYLWSLLLLRFWHSTQAPSPKLQAPSPKPHAFCLKILPAPTASHFPFMQGMAAYSPFLPGSSECQLLIPRAEGQSVPRTVAGQWLIPSLSPPHLLQFMLDQEPGTHSANNSRTPCLC